MCHISIVLEVPPWIAQIRPFLRSALDLLYPPHCESCQQPGTLLCRQCLKQIRRIRLPYCQRCCLPVVGCISNSFVCANCRYRKFHFQFAVCGCEAEAIIRLLIHRFKYQKMVRLSGILARFLFSAWRDDRIAKDPPSMLIPVPLHPRRERERGFNQALVLAKALSKYTQVPYGNSLKRIIFTPAQALLSQSQRRQNLHGAFALRQNGSLKGLHVMLVDDVLTTGSTLEECSKTLLADGVRAVSAITVARA